ncbi:MAG TPA: chorismate synthase, partial [Planctomycetota bacterium]|nr:chorismate synthase [Planctomycetota bacterium]
MATLTLDTAGESHGRGCFALVQGMPAEFPVDVTAINADLARRQKGYGRGARQKIETDQVEILSGVLHGLTIGAPILLAVWNKDVKIERMPELKAPRPGHADLAGALKFDAPIRHILERASARETTARVAAGALARLLLQQFGIEVRSHVLRIGSAAVPVDFRPSFGMLANADASDVRCLHAAAGEKMREAIQAAGKTGDTLGGVYEVVVEGLPMGLGSHAQWTAKLDGRLAQAIVSIQAHKGMEVGLGFRSAELPGSQVHDEIRYTAGKHPKSGGFHRPTDGHGGTEGGMSTGAPLIVR